MDQETIKRELDLQAVRVAAFNDGYNQAMKFVTDLINAKPEEKKEIDGAGISADSGNTSSPS